MSWFLKKRRGESFDPAKAKEEAKRCAKNEEYVPSSSELDYLRNKDVQNNKTLPENEYFLERSENISQKAEIENIEIEEALDLTIETCQQSDAPYPISVIRDLQVEVVFDSGESKEVKICRQHSYEKKWFFLA